MIIPETITSRDNQKVKFARNVRDGRETEFIFIEGVRLSEETLHSNITITQAFFVEGFAEKPRNRELLDELVEQGVEAFELTEKVFRSLADTENAQGVVLLAERATYSLASIEKRLGVSGTLPIVLFLHQINNPSNLGAILRTAEAADVAGVVCSIGSTDAFSAKSLRASMGAAFRIPVLQNAELDDLLDWAKSKGLAAAAADIHAAAKYTDIDWRTPRLLIFGSEAHGISGDDLSKIKESIYIPMHNETESLNLAVSCGIILFEAARQNSSN